MLLLLTQITKTSKKNPLDQTVLEPACVATLGYRIHHLSYSYNTEQKYILQILYCLRSKPPKWNTLLKFNIQVPNTLWVY